VGETATFLQLAHAKQDKPGDLLDAWTETVRVRFVEASLPRDRA
jgi:hypothetical protein